MNRLKEKVAIVTGSTSGIGIGIARLYAAEGAKVVICGRREEKGQAVVESIQQDGGEASYHFMDITVTESIEKLMADTAEKYGKIDILVNNAGMSAMDKIYDYKEEDFKKIMDLNVTAVFNCSRAVVNYMRENGGGVILNTSSMVSIYGQPSGCGYPASKFAVNGLTKSLARELGKDNIRVNAVAPGVTLTDMMKNVPESVIEPIIKGIPLGRIGTPEDIANAFLYLASDNASYVTGEILSVDGCART